MEYIENRVKLLDEIGVEGKRFVELGVYKCEYTAEILKRKPATLYLVDPWKAQSAMRYYDVANSPQEDFDKIFFDVFQKYGDHKDILIMREFSHEAVRKFDKVDPLDIVFVDANHSFGNCFHDLVAWSLRVKKGGWMMIHDMTGCFYGVPLAVNEFCKITGNEIAYMTTEDWATAAIQLK